MLKNQLSSILQKVSHPELLRIFPAVLHIAERQSPRVAALSPVAPSQEAFDPTYVYPIIRDPDFSYRAHTTTLQDIFASEPVDRLFRSMMKVVLPSLLERKYGK